MPLLGHSMAYETLLLGQEDNEWHTAVGWIDVFEKKNGRFYHNIGRRLSDLSHRSVGLFEKKDIDGAAWYRISPLGLEVADEDQFKKIRYNHVVEKAKQKDKMRSSMEEGIVKAQCKDYNILGSEHDDGSLFCFGNMLNPKSKSEICLILFGSKEGLSDYDTCKVEGAADFLKHFGLLKQD